MEEEEEHKRSPIVYILAIFLALILIVTFVPFYSIKADPHPKNVPGLEIIPEIDTTDLEVDFVTRNEYPILMKPSDKTIKYVADRIVSESCLEEGKYRRVCHAKAIYYFVHNNFDYVSDPRGFEYVKPAKLTLASKAIDCDDGAVLAANLLEAVGIETRFVFIPGHVYIQAYLPDALARYKEDDWVSLDLTCVSCDFGELPYTTADKEKVYVG